MVFKLVATFLLACIFRANALSKVEFNNCDRSAPIQIHRVEVSSPIVIQPRSKIQAHATYTNTYNPNRDTLLTIHVNGLRKKVFWGFPLNVLGLPGVSGLMESLPETLKCSQIEDLVPIKLCPGAQGSQKFQGSFIVPSNLKLPSIIRRIGSGTYKVNADIREFGTGRKVVCVKDAIVKIKL